MAQGEDPDLGLVRSWLEGGQVPDLADILYENASVTIYWYQRDQLYLQEWILYCRTPDGVEQLAVPKAVSEEFLKEADTGITN